VDRPGQWTAADHVVHLELVEQKLEVINKYPKVKTIINKNIAFLKIKNNDNFNFRIDL